MPDNTRKETKQVNELAKWEMELLKTLPIIVPVAPLMKAKFVWGAADLIQRTVETLI